MILILFAFQFALISNQHLLFTAQKTNKMQFSCEKELPFLNLRMRKKSTKENRLCSTCSLLKREVRQLKELQQKLSKEIKLIIAFIPKQIEAIMAKIKTVISQPSHDKTQHSRKTSNNSIPKKLSEHRDSVQSKTAFQSKLKEEDGIIKQSIYKELKAIRALESKQKDLRIVNQKHQTLRKSLSKESINSINSSHANKMRKLQSSPRLIQGSNPNISTDNMIFNCDANTENQFVNSPKFGKINEDFKFQAKIRYSSQDGKSKKNSDLQGKVEIEHLKCANGHECYKGSTLNHLPHGNGTLVNCCSKIPFKVNPKTLKYTGNFKFGQFEGKGTLICKDNVKFQGSFSKGMRHGEGIIFLQGASEKGFWEQDKLVSFI